MKTARRHSQSTPFQLRNVPVVCLLVLVLLCQVPSISAQDDEEGKGNGNTDKNTKQDVFLFPQEKEATTTTTSTSNGATVTATTVSSSSSATSSTNTAPGCTPQLLTKADISGNQFVSRAEYVNLLLDLAPPGCPIIQAWLNEEPLARVFNELSCLCHEFGGMDGEQNCCLQAVGLPMLASFATPFNTETNYPENYASLVCTKIDRVISEQCGPIISEAPTESPTTEAPSPAQPDDVATTLEPTVSVTEEGTHAGGTEEIVIQDGQVVLDIYIQDDDSLNVFEEDNDKEQQPENEENTDDDGGDVMEEDIEETQNDIQQQHDHEKEASVATTSPSYTAGTASQDDLPPPTPTVEEEPQQPQDATANNSTTAAATNAVVDTSSETPVGVVLAALFVIAFIFTLAGWVVWTKRRQLFDNQPWNKSGAGLTSNSNLSYTKDENEEDDSGDDDLMMNCEDDLPTPIRSNVSGSKPKGKPSSNRSFSSDDGDSSGTDTDDDNDATATDIERAGFAMHTCPTAACAGMGGKKGVVRVEFQDDLSVWGRKKRRKSERQQRREERRRASLEDVAPERKNNLNTILSNLELDLCGPDPAAAGNASVTAGGIEVLGRPSSFHSLASESTKGGTPPGTPVGASNTNNAGDHLALDIFDDASDSSSYAGSPQHDQNVLPLETSVEDWLANNAVPLGAGAVTSDDRSVSSKLSVASSKASTGSFVKQPQHSKIRRQPQDPLLQDWNAQRQKQRMGTPTKIGFGSFQVASSSASPIRPYASSSTNSGPGSPVVVLQETLSLRSRSNSESLFQKTADNGETKHADTPPYEPKNLSLSLDGRKGDSKESRRPHKLDLPASQNLGADASTRIAPKLSPESQEFYDSVLKMEPPEEDENSRGNTFAFEAARPQETVPPERYFLL